MWRPRDKHELRRDDDDDAEITGRDLWLGTSENTFRGGYRAKHRSNYFCSALETGANVDNIVPTNRRVMTPDDSPANSNNPFSSSFNPFPFFFSFQERISQLVDLVVFWNVYGARFFTVNLSWH